MCNSRRPGRPLGEVAQAILQHLSNEGPTTARGLGENLQLSMKLVWDTCNRLAASGEIEVVHRRVVTGVNKPVAVYALRQPVPAQSRPRRLPAAFFAGR